MSGVFAPPLRPFDLMGGTSGLHDDPLGSISLACFVISQPSKCAVFALARGALRIPQIGTHDAPVAER